MGLKNTVSKEIEAKKKEQAASSESSEIQRLVQRVQQLTEENEKLQSADLILKENEKLRKENDRLRKDAAEAEREKEISISTCRKREYDLDAKENRIEQTVQKRVNALLLAEKRKNEELLDKERKAAELENKRLLEAAETESQDMRESAAVIRRLSVFLLVCCIVVGLISGIIITNRLLDKKHVAKIKELEAVNADQEKLLDAEYYIFEQASWSNNVELTATDGSGSITLNDKDVVRVVKDGGSGGDYVLAYDGKEYTLNWATFMSYFRKIRLP